MKSFILSNYQWIFSGIGVLIAGLIIKKINPKRGTNKNPAKIFNVINNISNNSKAINNLSEIEDINNASNKKDIRIHRNILFIDDDVKFKIVSILKKSGWKNVEIRKDITSLQAPEIIAADIIFVDIQGVGLKLGFKDQGLGLVHALKETYPNKKIVIYSAVQLQDPFKPAFRIADDMLSKNAEAYEFEKIISEYTN
jgi:hypothetical protein